MILSWWDTPGPAWFVETATNHIREGRNLFLQLPRHYPPGLRDAIRRRVSTGFDAPWRTVELSELDPACPAGSFLKFFDASAVHCDPVSVRDLISNERFNSGFLIWVDNVPEDSWPRWRAFFEEYAHACRAVDLLNRSLYCVNLIGPLALFPPVNDVCLAKLKWQGIVSQLDSLLYSSRWFADRPWPVKKKQLASHVAAFLGQWDPVLIDQLCACDFRSLLEPRDILKDFGNARGWNQVDLKKSASKWVEGISDQYEGMERDHCGFLALNGSDHLIRHKIWSAETAVLFPRIEEYRHQLLDSLSRHLTPPYRSLDGTLIEDARDLELSDLMYLLANNPVLWIRDEGWAQLKMMKNARNQLAHRQPVDPEVLDSEELFRITTSALV